MTGAGWQPSLRPEDLRQDTAFFGRTEELCQLARNLQLGRHTLLVGEKGAGKSRLMVEARWIFSGSAARIDCSPGVMTRIRGQLGVRIDPKHYKILFLEHTSPLGDCLKEMAEKLFYNRDLPLGTRDEAEREDWTAAKKQLAGLGSLRIQAAIFEGIARSPKPYLIFFDNLDRIAPGQHSFIESLLNIAVVCAAVVQMKETFFFRRIWASFTKIELAPLPEPVCIQLIEYFFGHYRLRIIDRELYKREILKASHGNPFFIKNMLWHGSRERFIDTGEIRSLRQADEGRYFNMGPVYIFGVALLTISRIVAAGQDKTELTIYFSALGFIAYLVFRVFRAFFLFRPQKYG